MKQFASDDATVVIGTVIDPEMTDEIRVTVVATGLGQAVGLSEKPMKVVRRWRRRRRKGREPNYNELEKPAVQRKRAVGDGVTGNDEPRGPARHSGVPAAAGGLNGAGAG